MLQEEDINGDAICVLCRFNAFPHDSDSEDEDDPDLHCAAVVVVSRPCGHCYHQRCHFKWMERPDLCSGENRRISCPECGRLFKSQETVNVTRSKDLMRRDNAGFKFGLGDIRSLVEYYGIPIEEAMMYSNRLEPPERGSRGGFSMVRGRPETFRYQPPFDERDHQQQQREVFSTGHLFRVCMLIVIGVVLLLFCWFADDDHPMFAPNGNKRPVSRPPRTL